MTREERLAYARGYQARADKWPAHKPPVPPEPIIAELVQALRELRDACDGLMATLEPTDSFVLQLDPGVSRADAALTMLSGWLRT